MRIFLLSLIIGLTSILKAQDPIKIAKNSFTFLAGKSSVNFLSRASMSYDLDSIHLMENFTYKVKLKDHQKINFRWDDGLKRKLINYDGHDLTFFSLDDGFYRKFKIEGELPEVSKFVNDSLSYDFPLITLFFKDGFQRVEKVNPSSYYLGKKHYKGHQVHHLAFQTKNFTWQMFVSSDTDYPVPYKVIVNDLIKNTQFINEFESWDFSEIEDKEFSKTIGDFIEIK